MRNAILLGILLAGIVSTGSAAIQGPDYTIKVDVTAPAREKWIEIRSEHFHIIGNTGEKNVRRVALDLEDLREHLLGPLRRRVPISDRDTTVIVLRDTKSFRLYNPDQISRTPGYVQRGIDRDYVVVNAGEKDRQDLQHELV